MTRVFTLQSSMAYNIVGWERGCLIPYLLISASEVWKGGKEEKSCSSGYSGPLHRRDEGAAIKCDYVNLNPPHRKPSFIQSVSYEKPTAMPVHNGGVCLSGL